MFRLFLIISLFIFLPFQPKSWAQDSMSVDSQEIQSNTEDYSSLNCPPENTDSIGYRCAAGAFQNLKNLALLPVNLYQGWKTGEAEFQKCNKDPKIKMGLLIMIEPMIRDEMDSWLSRDCKTIQSMLNNRQRQVMLGIGRKNSKLREIEKRLGPDNRNVQASKLYKQLKKQYQLSEEEKEYLKRRQAADQIAFALTQAAKEKLLNCTTLRDVASKTCELIITGGAVNLGVKLGVKAGGALSLRNNSVSASSEATTEGALMGKEAWLAQWSKPARNIKRPTEYIKGRSGEIEKIRFQLKDGSTKEIKIAKSLKYQMDELIDEKLLKSLNISAIPDSVLKQIDKIKFDYLSGDISGKVTALFAPRTIVIDPRKITPQLFTHETGHVVHFHTPKFRRLWKWAVKKDGGKNNPVTEYGRTNYKEDFAETLVAYLEPSKALRAKYQQQYPTRFEVMDELLKGHHFTQNASQRVGFQFLGHQVVIVTAVGGGVALLYMYNDSGD